MDIEQLLDTVRSLDGILVLAPVAGSGAPEIAWGDYFFYYAPDGQVPTHEQPFATIVTKDYPDDTASKLDTEGRWRVNVHVGQAALQRLVGGAVPSTVDFAAADTFLPHPVYGALGWVAVVNPGKRTAPAVVELVRSAHADARRRAARRAEGS